MSEELEEFKFYADRFRGMNKVSGPHWSAILRIPKMYDMIVALQQQNAALVEQLKEANEDAEWLYRRRICQRLAPQLNHEAK